MKNDIDFIDLEIELITPTERFAIYYLDGEPTNYAVSTEGRLYNIKTGNFRKPRVRPDGHTDVNLSFGSKDSCKTFMLYRMVAETFLEGQDKDNRINSVDHLNGTEFGDGVNNLEWVTQSENTIRARKQGRMKHSDDYKGENHPDHVYTETQVRIACELKSLEVVSKQQISEASGIKYDYLDKIFNGSKWAHVSCEYDLKLKHNRKYPEGLKERIIELADEGLSNSEIKIIVEKEFSIELTSSYVKDAKRIRKKSN